MKIIKLILLTTLIINLDACEIYHEINTKKPAHKINAEKSEQKIIRTLMLSGKVFKEGEPWQFLSWRCRDYSYGGKTLVEVGRALMPNDYKNTNEYNELNDAKKQELDKFLKMIGFVLYDGSNTGDITFYNRDGLSHRWDWGVDENSYTFVIKPDGTGLFYDFSTAENGIKNKADEIFKCGR